MTQQQLTQPPLPVKGIRLAAKSAGMRYRGRADLAIIEIDGEQTAVAAVFTRNQFPAAPITIAREYLARGTPRYLLINSGYANAGLGDIGIADARECCRALAELCDIDTSLVLPFSTGIIGERMPVAKLTEAIPGMLPHLKADQWNAVAEAIMTTDTVTKWASTTVDYKHDTITITGIAKGSGMICPNMATMLSFIATDIILDTNEARELLAAACDTSFNRITVDGDTSTNDACVLMASGQANIAFSDLNQDEQRKFTAALNQVTMDLAEQIVRDAEGAKHFITICVEAAPDAEAAQKIARAVAHSPLVKTAVAGGDPNWGRVIAAVGYAGVDIEAEKVSVYFGDCRVFKKGALDPDYTEPAGLQAMSGRDIEIRIVLGSGDAQVRILTSDLTKDYIDINTQYRS